MGLFVAVLICFYRGLKAYKRVQYKCGRLKGDALKVFDLGVLT